MIIEIRVVAHQRVFHLVGSCSFFLSPVFTSYGFCSLPTDRAERSTAKLDSVTCRSNVLTIFASCSATFLSCVCLSLSPVVSFPSFVLLSFHPALFCVCAITILGFLYLHWVQFRTNEARARTSFQHGFGSLPFSLAFVSPFVDSAVFSSVCFLHCLVAHVFPTPFIHHFFRTKSNKARSHIVTRQPPFNWSHKSRRNMRSACYQMPRKPHANSIW